MGMDRAKSDCSTGGLEKWAVLINARQGELLRRRRGFGVSQEYKTPGPVSLVMGRSFCPTRSHVRARPDSR